MGFGGRATIVADQYAGLFGSLAKVLRAAA
jgi:hypothetical protein